MKQGELCLVTGATGAVGPALVEELLSEGYRVRALARHAPRAPFPAGVEMVLGDVADREKTLAATRGASMVFHMAAKLHVSNPGREMQAEYERVNVEGTRNVVLAAQASSARRLVLFSTVSVYGQTGAGGLGSDDRSWADEDAAPHPDTIYAETKLRAEEIALTGRNGEGEPLCTVLRMAAVYGPGMKGNYVSLARALARGYFFPVGNGANLRTLVYDRDAARAAVLAARHPAAAGRVYNVSDGSVHALREIIEAICLALGRRPPRLSVPVPAARIAAGALDSALSVAGRRRRFSVAVEKITESAAIRADRIQRELGFKPEYDLRHGWVETIAALSLGRGTK